MSASTLRIGVLMPEVLGTYGDSGNALILAERARRRGIDAEVVHVGLTEEIPESLDIYTLGGGEDTAQALAADKFRGTSGLARALDAGRPLLAICASAGARSLVRGCARRTRSWHGSPRHYDSPSGAPGYRRARLRARP